MWTRARLRIWTRSVLVEVHALHMLLLILICITFFEESSIQFIILLACWKLFSHMQVRHCHRHHSYYLRLLQSSIWGLKYIPSTDSPYCRLLILSTGLTSWIFLLHLGFCRYGILFNIIRIYSVLWICSDCVQAVWSWLCERSVRSCCLSDKTGNTFLYRRLLLFQWVMNWLRLWVMSA